MRTPSQLLGRDDGRPGAEPAFIPGSPSAIAMRGAAGSRHALRARGLAGLRALLKLLRVRQESR